MAVAITLDELLSELNRLDQKEAIQGYSLRELQEKIGKSESKTKDLIRRGQAEGIIRCQRDFRAAIDGTLRPVPVYVFVPPNKPKRTRIADGKVRAS